MQRPILFVNFLSTKLANCNNQNFAQNIFAKKSEKLSFQAVRQIEEDLQTLKIQQGKTNNVTSVVQLEFLLEKASDRPFISTETLESKGTSKSQVFYRHIHTESFYLFFYYAITKMFSSLCLLVVPLAYQSHQSFAMIEISVKLFFLTFNNLDVQSTFFSEYLKGASFAFYKMAKLNDSDIIYNSLPMYHGFGGFICIGIALFHGCTVVMKRKFSASNFWKDCIRHNCTVSIEANVTYQLVYNIFFFLKRLSCILVSYADIWSISQLRTLRLNIKSDWQSVMA